MPLSLTVSDVLAEAHAYLSERLAKTPLGGKNVRAWWVLDNLAALRDDPRGLTMPVEAESPDQPPCCHGWGEVRDGDSVAACPTCHSDAYPPVPTGEA